MENYSPSLTGMAGETRDTWTTYCSKVKSKQDNGDSITITYNNINLVSEGGPEGAHWGMDNNAGIFGFGDYNGFGHIYGGFRVAAL